MAKKRKKKQPKSGFFWLVAFIFSLIASIVLVGASTHILALAEYPKDYSEYVTEYAADYDVDENLVYAVIRSESRFDPNAVSDIGACGLMQITQETFDWAKSRMPRDDGASYEEIFDPQVNIKYGVYILSLLLDEFSDERTAIAAYHAGWGNVKNWLSDTSHSKDGEVIDSIPFPDTNAYVNQVIHSQRIYQTIYSGSFFRCLFS